jgi:hypothetical protein
MIFQHRGHAKAYSFNASQIHVLQASAPQALQTSNQ